MLNKKSPNANLENKKSISLLLGLVLALSALYIGLEWSGETKIYSPVVRIGIEPPPVILPTRQDEKEKLPEKPKVKLKSDPTVVSLNSNPVAGGFKSVDSLKGESKLILFPTEPVFVPIKEDTIFDFSEYMPQFPGDVFSFLSQNLRYPSVALRSNIQGKVTCQFIVDKDGSITDVTVAVPVDPALDKEAVRVIESMPKWSPGIQNDVPVRVRYTLPVYFKLN